MIGVAVVVLILLWTVASYNGLVSKDETVKQKWADVESQYQRRADLIPNLVATVKQYTNYEGPLLTEITQARSAWTGAATTQDQVQAAGAMDSAIARLLVVAENYPVLKANEQFLGLQDELAGTENRVQYARSQYNEAVKNYNQQVRRFPTNLLAGMFGFEQKESFAAQDGAENAPNVDTLFNN